MFSYNTPGAITIYVFIGIAIIGIFVALIYTKVIKKKFMHIVINQFLQLKD